MKSVTIKLKRDEALATFHALALLSAMRRVSNDMPARLRREIKTVERVETKLARLLGEILIVHGRCRYCACTNEDCSGCFERTGHACYWVLTDICSACVPVMPVEGAS